MFERALQGLGPACSQRMLEQAVKLLSKEDGNKLANNNSMHGAINQLPPHYGPKHEEWEKAALARIARRRGRRPDKTISESGSSGQVVSNEKCQ